MKISNELKTGVLVIAALCVGALFWYKTTNFTAKPYTIKTSFTFADGIKPDSIVKLSGVDVGRVTAINFVYEPDTKVELTMAIDRNARVREDSIAYISVSGLVGDAYLGLTPGSGGKKFLEDGATIASEDPMEMRKFWKKAEGIAENFDKTLVQVRALTENVNTLVKDNKPKIDSITANLEKTSVNFNEFSDDIKKHPWKLLIKGK